MAAAKPMVTDASVSAANAIRTPQFWLLWTVLFCNVTAGIGILEQASPMIQDFFRDGDGSAVAAAAAAGFVGLLSICNMAGRFVWSSTSDHIGRKPIYMVYLGVGVVLYLGLALAGTTSTVLFVVLAGLIISFYGGGFATLNSNVTPLLARMFGMRDLHVAIAVASWFEPVSGFGAMVAWAMHIRHDEAGGETTESCERPALLLLILLSTRSCLSACTRELACQCHNAALLLSVALC